MSLMNLEMIEEEKMKGTSSLSSEVTQTLAFALNLTCFPLIKKRGLMYMSRDNSVGIAARYGLDGRLIEYRGWGGGHIYRNPLARSWGPPSVLHNGYGSFPGVNPPGRGVDNAPTSSVEVKGRAELQLCPLLCLISRL